MGRWLALLVPLTLGVACAHHEASDEPSFAQRDEGSPLIDEREAEAGPAVQAPSEPPPRAREPGTIFRDELVRATRGGKPGYLTRQLDPKAYRPAGRFQGWQINQVFPDDPGLCGPDCGLRPKDVVLTVNGSPLERPEQLSALVESIGEMSQLRVRLVRDGKLYEQDYAIVD